MLNGGCNAILIRWKYYQCSKPHTTSQVITSFIKPTSTYIQQHHYALNSIDQKLIAPDPTNHSDDELALVVYYPLLKV